jgi:hypothetical protein
MLIYVHAMTGRPVLVTEHGLGTDHDPLSASYNPAALAEPCKVISGGVAVQGYMLWSLIDPYNWIFDVRNKFGLHGVDLQTFARTPRPGAQVYAAIARANAGCKGLHEVRFRIFQMPRKCKRLQLRDTVQRATILPTGNAYAHASAATSQRERA